MRALTSILLALLLTVTSVTFAAARVQAAGLTQMVICAQGAARVVTFDAAGNPVEVPHHCPDCLAALPPIPSPAALPSHRVPARPILLIRADAQVLAPQVGHAPSARGPPVTV